MAILTPGAMIGAISGSIGGTTFSHNKGGPYIRTRAIPTNPNTARQQAVRTILASLAAAWSNVLTAAQRATWDAFAEANTITNALGQSVKITGLGWYLRCGARLMDAGGTVPTAAPTAPGPAGLLTFTPSFSSTTAIDVAFTAALPGNEHLQVFMTGPDNAGATPNFNQAVLVGYSAAAAASPVALTLPRAVPVGQFSTFFGAVLDTQGLISAYSTLRVEST